jgi:hypothetical protein
MLDKEGSDARHEVVVTVGIGPEDPIIIVIALETPDLAQKGDDIVAGGEAFGIPCGGDGILLDLVALGGIKRHVRPP